MIERHAAQIDGGLAIEEDLEIIELDDGIPLALLGEFEQIGKSRTAAALDPQTKARLTLDGNQTAHFLLGGISQLDHRTGRFAARVGAAAGGLDVGGRREAQRDVLRASGDGHEPVGAARG